MTAEKRYYWLKIKEDFFGQKEIKKLRKIAGGDTFTIIYLKMLLRSLKDGGRLYYDGVESNFASELALDIDEDEENVKMTVAFLMANRILVQISSEEYDITTADELTGSETESARRVRKHRAERALKEAAALQCNGDVTDCNTYRVRAIAEQELQQEQNSTQPGNAADVNSDTVEAYARANLMYLSPTHMQELASFMDDMEPELIRYAVDKACENGKRTWAYTKAILNGLLSDGIKTVGEAKAADEARQRKKNTPPSMPQTDTDMSFEALY